jgi:hypothetical protein
MRSGHGGRRGRFPPTSLLPFRCSTMRCSTMAAIATRQNCVTPRADPIFLNDFFKSRSQHAGVPHRSRAAGCRPQDPKPSSAFRRMNAALRLPIPGRGPSRSIGENPRDTDVTPEARPCFTPRAPSKPISAPSRCGADKTPKRPRDRCDGNVNRNHNMNRGACG